MDAFMGAEFAVSKYFLSFHSEWSMVTTKLQQCYPRDGYPETTYPLPLLSPTLAQKTPGMQYKIVDFM